MELEKNYQQDKDYLKSLEKEFYEIVEFEAFDKEYARQIFETALMLEWKIVEEEEDCLVKRIKIIKICEEIGFQSLANKLTLMA